MYWWAQNGKSGGNYHLFNLIFHSKSIDYPPKRIILATFGNSFKHTQVSLNPWEDLAVLQELTLIHPGMSRDNILHQTHPGMWVRQKAWPNSPQPGEHQHSLTQVYEAGQEHIARHIASNSPWPKLTQVCEAGLENIARHIASNSHWPKLTQVCEAGQEHVQTHARPHGVGGFLAPLRWSPEIMPWT